MQENGEQSSISSTVVGNCVFPRMSSNNLMRHLSSGCDLQCREKYNYFLKVILLGDQGAGKTSFMKALQVHPDIIKIHSKTPSCQVNDHLDVEVTTCNDQKVLVRLCDTGGQERYRSLTSSYYRGAQGVILMINLCNNKSLDQLDLWLSDLNTFVTSSSCVRLLVGTYCTSPHRTVLSNVARMYAESRDLSYTEIDCTHFYNIIESVQIIVNDIVKNFKPVSSDSSFIIRPISKQERSSKFLCLC
ncbi:Ras- protein RABA2a [Bulinus truncatus]|nr:Ras- protein RABA2a [Bulinus truncatus]